MTPPLFAVELTAAIVGVGTLLVASSALEMFLQYFRGRKNADRPVVFRFTDKKGEPVEVTLSGPGTNEEALRVIRNALRETAPLPPGPAATAGPQ